MLSRWKIREMFSTQTHRYLTSSFTTQNKILQMEVRMECYYYVRVLKTKEYMVIKVLIHYLIHYLLEDISLLLSFS